MSKLQLINGRLEEFDFSEDRSGYHYVEHLDVHGHMLRQERLIPADVALNQMDWLLAIEQLDEED